MRTNLFLYFLIIAPLFLNAQNVGIGTSSPQTKLHVNGFGPQHLRVHSFTNNLTAEDVGLRLTRSSVVFGNTDWQILNNTSLVFTTATDDFISGDGTERMRLTSTGDLGIGTTTPKRALHAFRPNGSGEAMLRVEGVLNNAGIEMMRTSGFGDDIDWRIIAGGSGALRFQHSTSDEDYPTWLEDMLLTSSGQLGIGVSNPAAKLHVRGGEDVNYTDDGHLMLGENSATNMIIDQNEILARNNGNPSPLYLQFDGGDVLLCTQEAGGVGIGVGSGNIPNGYLLAVDGKIVSEELRVDLSGSWPDYVFAEDYLLTPLNELEHEITTLGHLPGMPSAAEVENGGQMVGDMQRRLLEKVEELTLYTIAQQKEIESLKQALAGRQK